MGEVLSINISNVRGVEKSSVPEVKVIEGWGLEGDAHGGDWSKQVSIFPVEALAKVPPHKKEEVLSASYTENFTISGLSPQLLTVGSQVQLGEAIIEIYYVGKEEFKEHGRPYIVSREGRFGKVIRGGIVRQGDKVELIS